MVERCHSERYALTDLAQPFEKALQLGLVPLRASRRSQIQSPGLWLLLRTRSQRPRHRRATAPAHVRASA
jgi:hypothetical protein